MGGQQSNYINAHKKLDRQESSLSDEFVDISVAEDVLIDVLSFVSVKDLFNNCRSVCKEWKEIIDGHSLWVLKCERENIQAPKCMSGNIPENYHRNIYLYVKSKGNYIKNPCGEERLNDWEIFENGGDGFAVENPPGGADPVPAEVGSQSCFATSYGECRMAQLIDLYSTENNKYLLKNGVVSISVGEWYAARFDCACEYKLVVTLLDNAKYEVDEFSFKISEQQWNGREWHLVTHNFNDVSTVRYVRFEHSGKDRQFWAGHYGSKMTGAFVKLNLVHSS